MSVWKAVKWLAATVLGGLGGAFLYILKDQTSEKPSPKLAWLVASMRTHWILSLTAVVLFLVLCIQVYEEVLRRFGDAPESGLREQVAKALFNKGVRLGQLNRNEQARAAFQEVVQRFGASQDRVLNSITELAESALREIDKLDRPDSQIG